MNVRNTGVVLVTSMKLCAPHTHVFLTVQSSPVSPGKRGTHNYKREKPHESDVTNDNDSLGYLNTLSYSPLLVALSNAFITVALSSESKSVNW